MPLLINDCAACVRWLTSLGVTNATRGYANLLSLAKILAGDDENRIAILPAGLGQGLCQCLPQVADPDRALNNLERFSAAEPTWLRENLEFLADSTNADEFESKSMMLRSLLSLFADSQYLSDLLIQNRVSVVELFETCGRPQSRQSLIDHLREQLSEIPESGTATALIRKFKQQQTARIAFGDLIHGQRLETVVQQISWLAEAVCQCALQWAHQQLASKIGMPMSSNGVRARFVVLAMGKLGGTELNYSSDIDLVLVYDLDGLTDSAKPTSNREFFECLTRDLIRILSEPMIDRPAYRIDLRLRPEGSRGRICSSYKSITHYYDFQGRTWERQALIKAKPIAGDLDLGKQLLTELQPWIYQSNLNRADIAGIKALKRGMERRAIVRGESETNVKTGHGGIRDIEFVIQFLQLLNGGVIPDVQSPNTMQAIMFLESAGCLTTAEATLLSQNYRWLRKLEHRLQLMFDLQTHTLPDDSKELTAIARRMGYPNTVAEADPLSLFKSELNERTNSNRTILNHLLHGAFGNTFGSLRDSGGHLAFAGDDRVPAEVELILDPDPDQEIIERVLAPYNFSNVSQAFENLMELARENTAFLSSRRCHHFLAAIAPTLLEQIARTPDPDATLVSLASVSETLGAKGVLWELFSFNPPTLNLYVRLCATSDYLARILKTNPGMIDELLDALQVEQLPSFELLSESMNELVQGAEDIEPIVFSFKHAQHLREGIRDILGRDEIQNTHQALADVADVCLQTVARHEFRNLTKRLEIGSSDAALNLNHVPFVMLALGKLGGREPNYHSDLDLIFLYNHDPVFESLLPSNMDSQFFFGELAANITAFITHSNRFGSLYELDCRLRPTGKSGILAVSLDELSRYFESGSGRLWERQALCKARPVSGSAELQRKTMEIVKQAILQTPWQPSMCQQIVEMRLAMEQDCSPQNLKRGTGGTVDIEFAVQMLQMRYGHVDQSVLVPGTLAAIERFVALGFLTEEIGNGLTENYKYLRNVESHLRLINTTARHDLPTDQKVLKKLAYLLSVESAEVLSESVTKTRHETRRRFQQIVDLLA